MENSYTSMGELSNKLWTRRALINQHEKDYYPNRKWLKEMKCNLPRRNMNDQEAFEHMFSLIRN